MQKVVFITYSEFSIISRLRLTYTDFIFGIVCSVRLIENFEKKCLGVRAIEKVLIFGIVVYV